MDIVLCQACCQELAVAQMQKLPKSMQEQPQQLTIGTSEAINAVTFPMLRCHRASVTHPLQVPYCALQPPMLCKH
jgi:hypothetical protein